MARNQFWLSDEQWARIEPHLPTDVRGKERVDDRRVISGIVHVLKIGCRWEDVPPEYGPHTTIYNRFVRWAERGVWQNLFNAVAARGRSTHKQMIDSTHVKAHRSASGGEGGEENQAVGRSRGGRNTKIHAITDAKGRLLNFVLTGGEAHDCPIGAELIEESKPAEHMLADKGYDSAELRRQLKDRGTKAVIPNRRRSFASTVSSIGNGTRSKMPFVGSRISGVSRHGMTNWLSCSRRQFISPLP
jgi:transposase